MPLATPPRKIAVFRALQLGDLLCAVPALRALRKAWPDAHVTLIGLAWARDFVERMPYLDAFLEFPGFPGMPEREPDVPALPGFFLNAQAVKFDLAIQMHGSGGLSNTIVAALGARRSAGFVIPGAWCAEPENYLPWPDDLHELRRLLALADFLGAPPCGEHIELPMLAQEQMDFDRLKGQLGLQKGRYICVHPGARLPSRRWLPERFAAVADALAGEGLRILLTGTREETGIIAAVAAKMRAPHTNLCGETSLGVLAALVGGARLVVSNDTGMSHVAAALATPSVVVSCGADVTRWKPLNAALHPAVWAPAACRPCVHHRCPTEHECATDVSVEAVLAMARRLLATHEPTPGSVP